MKKNGKKILLVDDEEHILQSYELTLNAGGFEDLILCSDSRKVVQLLRDHEIELVVLDLTMPYLSGEDILEILKENFPWIPVIIITGNLEVDTAVKCMKGGAIDYLIKPVDSEKLISAVKRAVQVNQLLVENRNLKNSLLSRKVENDDIFRVFNSRSGKMISIFKYAEAIAVSPEPILLTGETGVGKELMARAIHNLSGRGGEFIPVSIAGLDENMFTDTLFGHKKGAFTDARDDRMGLIESAENGTLFLDEIGDLSLQSQIRLLRLIQEREYSKLGEDLIRFTNARIITATNCDLSSMISSQEFRKDLYYRLEVHKIYLPPLVERLEDLPLLIDHFLNEASELLQKGKPAVPPELFTLLRNYRFPGNIRELRSMVVDAMSVPTRGTLSMDLFRKQMRLTRNEKEDAVEPDVSEAGFQFPMPLPSLKEAERALIDQVMEETGRNQSVAADILGISRQTLNKKLNS